MSMIMDYLELALSGFGRFIAEYKYLALIVGILFYAFARWEKHKERSAGKFLLYVMVVMILLMIPVTGIIFLIYQTRFYDYEWVWSMVPLTVTLAWGIVVVIYDEKLPGTDGLDGQAKKRKQFLARLLGMAAAIVVLGVCGNQGKLQNLSEEELQMQHAGADILQYMESENLLQDSVLWGPKDILQYMRSHNGMVTLYYGRDMWDAKAGAYDYDVYEPEEIAGFEWMELISASRSLYLLEVDQAPENIHEALATDEYLREAVKRDVNIVILPSQIDIWIERKIHLIAEEENYSVMTASVGEYSLWILD